MTMATLSLSKSSHADQTSKNQNRLRECDVEMDALQYYKKYSQSELLAIMSDIENDPKNHVPIAEQTIFKLTPSARKKTAAIAQAIAWHVADKKKAAGNLVNPAGYSGRNRNR